MFYPAREIVDRVWVGSRQDAGDRAFFMQHRIGLVVNCSRDVPFKFANIQGFRIPVHDDPSENENLLNNLPGAVAAIEHYLQSNPSRGVLVHCWAGMQRSAAVVCAMLMRRHGWTPDAAMAYMKTKKPEVFFPRPTFEAALWALPP